MSVLGVLDALTRTWDGVHALLDAEDIARLRLLVDELAVEGDPETGLDIVEDIIDLLRSRLPVDHPVRQTARSEAGQRYAGPRPVTDTEHAAELATLFRTVEPLRVKLLGPTPTAAENAEASERWLLGLKALDEPALRGRGLDPDDPDLIRLVRPDGTAAWPRFQFETGLDLESVRLVNRELDAADDPLGAADWWLGHNGWLGGPPAELARALPVERLLDAVRADEREA